MSDKAALGCFMRKWLLLPVVWVMCGLAGHVHAGLFDDEEARKAILDLRQKVESVRQDGAKRADEDLRRANEERDQLRRSLLDLQNQIETIRAESAKLRGQNEQLVRDVSDLQRRHKDLAQGLDERLRKVEPEKVTVDGREFIAEPGEKRDFEAALTAFRKGEFSVSQGAFVDFVRRYPQSGYGPTSLFWLGNAQYATRDYKEAIVNFRSLLSAAPGHSKIPETLLSIANCQAELKDLKGARKTLEELIKTHPQSEAAAAGKERLSRLK